MLLLGLLLLLTVAAAVLTSVIILNRTTRDHRTQIIAVADCFDAMYFNRPYRCPG